MSDHDDFIRGLVAATNLPASEARERHVQWLQKEHYTEAMRLALESGGYDTGQMVGNNWDLTE
jgi:hypothetical protein